MAGLSAPELASLRDETEAWFDSTCDLYHQAGGDDAYGGRGGSYPGSPSLNDLPCNVESGIAHEQERSFIGRFEDIQLFTVTLPAQTDVRIDDRLVIALPAAQFLTVTVQAVLAPESIEIERKVIAVEVAGT